MNLPRTLITAAAGAYAANCSLGISVAKQWVDTSNFRWVHHGLYILTATTTAAAFFACATRRSPAALALAPAAAPLFLLQHHGARPLRRHTRDALLAAPCYAAGLVLARR
ncbi:hypothetical protein IEE91_04625 [Kocuria sp. cx-455]|uniref:hypothetical protein n=1 Tax=unclassified Candidatus Sulfotelmatobacter TaxID=2635724 RepID=UPI0016855E2B|nr:MULTISPECIES: hypothetical protein [unclassified Candidatus Sulfotelmatobacter]MBD2762499.1 hypothetical protein [Kocuria sp. cx-116]MBD2764487.1 hypothetical protein [Kocuria sp. cx-455]